MVMLNSSRKKIGVVIVDDSAFIRQTIKSILEQDPEIDVLATANDPYDAREKIKVFNPDVITLDVQMPKMDGIEFLRKIMTLRPMPVVMLSSLTEKGAEITLQALSLGAVDCIAKPSLKEGLEHVAKEICDKVKNAATAKIRNNFNKPIQKKLPLQLVNNINPRKKVIAIGSSTGGVEALNEIIPLLPAQSPAVLIAQHMPDKFTASFAARLDRTSSVTVVEATNGMLIEPGHVYLAPGGSHLRIAKKDGMLVTHVTQDPLVNGHRPSVDVLFESFAKEIPKQSVGVILTGMGKDGAEGLKKLHDLGALTYGQNQESCLVYGMPRAAKELGGVLKELPLEQIAHYILQSCSQT